VVTVTALAGLTIAGAMALFGLPPRGPAWAATPVRDHGPVLRWHPLGIAAVLGASAATLRAVAGLLSRRWLTVRLQWTRGSRRLVLAIGVALFVALTVRQQLRADLLAQDTWLLR